MMKKERMTMSNDTYTHSPTETRMLLKSGADSNLEMEDGRTPIHIAAEVLIMTIIDNINGSHMVALWCFFSAAMFSEYKSTASSLSPPCSLSTLDLQAGNIGVIKLLLENEADILATDKVYI